MNTPSFLLANPFFRRLAIITGIAIALILPVVSSPAAVETLPAGTYIIPMDNTLQGGGTFNLKAYGLAVRLLHAGVPLKWIINPTKGKDGVDFTASASRTHPSAQASASRNFISGPLAIHPGFESQALSVISGYGNNVAVFRLTNDTSVHVDSTIVHKPKVAVFNQGGNSGIHTDVLAAAGLTSGTHYQVVTNAESIGPTSCFTVATEPHSDAITANANTALLSFLRSGGNFLGQCAAVRGYTQRGLLAGYAADGNLGGSMMFDNFSDPAAQFHGGLSDEGGSVVSFKLTSNPGKRIAYSSGDGSRYKAYVGRVTGVTTTNGGWVHYLAGHSYRKSSGTIYTNGQRILLNAVLRPSDRPANCGLSLAAEYRVTKVVSNSTPEVGQNVTFTINAINDGPMPANNVVVNDLLPSGLTYVSHTTTGGTYVANTGVWTIGTLAAGASRSLTITATVTVAAIPSKTNTAVITSSTPDANTANNTASATVTPRRADLRVVKTVNEAAPLVGQNVTFTLTATNLGPDNATGVTVNDLLPAGLVYVSHGASTGLYNPATGVWTIGSFANGATATLTLTTTVTAAGFPSVINSTSITGNQYDPVPSNNFSSVTVSPTGTDYRVTKVVNNATPEVGQNVTFTINAINGGPTDAVDVVVNDLLPSGLVYVSHTTNVGTYVPATGVWTIGTLASGTNRTLTLTATATAAAIPSRTNTANITSTSPDSNPNDNTASATVTPRYADLRVVKTASSATPSVNQNITFTLSVTNLGPSDATNVLLNDLLPGGLTYVSHVAAVGTYVPASGVWTIGSLNSGVTQTLTITATVTTASLPSVINSATVTATQFDPVLSNNTSAVTVTPQVSDLRVVKTVDNGLQTLGNNVVFTVVATNLGPSTNTGVEVTDLLPSGLVYQSHTVSAGTYSQTTGIWTIGTMANGATRTLTITAQVAAAALPSATNTATITGNLYDPNLVNNTSSATVSPGFAANLGITKTVSAQNPILGGSVTFTLTASNAGPSAATGVVVQDLLPAGLIYQSHTASTGVYNPGTGQWAIGNLAIGATPTLTIVALTDDAALPSATNTAVIGGEEFDPDTSNNSDDVTVTPQYSDLAVVKTVDNAIQEVYGNVVFTIVATNLGTSNNTGVTVNDLLPAGLVYQSHTTSVGTYDSGTGVWTIGNLANGQSQTLTITAAVAVAAVPSVTNTATVTGEMPDPELNNNTSSAVVNPPGKIADLTVAKTVDNATPALGSNVTFTITVGNQGPFGATGVVVDDALPTGLQYVSHVASVGDYNPATGLWAVGNLAVNQTRTLAITVTILSEAIPSTTNIATVTGNELDLDINNNTASATVNPNVFADLQVVKSLNVSPVLVGDEVIYTLVATNNGPNDATSVVVSEPLPFGLEYFSHTATAGSYNPATGFWTIGNLANGASQTLVVTVKTNSLGGSTVPNTATITGRENDPVPANNTSQATLSILSGTDVAIVKSVNNETPLVGETVIFTLTMTNSGPQDATGVIITDILPGGFVSPSNISNGGTVTGNTITWPAVDIAVGQVLTFTFQATVAAP